MNAGWDIVNGGDGGNTGNSDVVVMAGVEQGCLGWVVPDSYNCKLHDFVLVDMV